MAEHLRPGYGRPGPIIPVAGINENVLVHRDNLWFLYRVTGIEAISPSSGMIVDFGTIAAQGTTADQSLETPLELGNKELGQFRIRVLDDIRLSVFQPRQAGRFTIKRVQTTVGLLSRINDPCGHLSEIFSFRDEFPFVDVNNPGDAALVTTRASFYGFRYKVEELSVHDLAELKNIPGPYTAVFGEALVRGGGEG